MPLLAQPPTMLSLRERQLLGFISTIFNPLDIGQLHETFNRYHKEEVLALAEQCRRTSISLSREDVTSLTSLTSTMSSIFSRHSHLSTSSSMSLTYGHGEDDHQPEYLGVAEKQHHITAQGREEHNHSVEGEPSAEFYCLTCKRCYGDKVGLQRHHKEKCESKEYYICRLCPQHTRATFERPEKLKQHHHQSHNVPGEFATAPNLDIKASKQKRPIRKSWGCPCCESCFHSVEAWHQHEKTHQKNIAWDGESNDIMVKHWSWSTLMTSLLTKSAHLGQFADVYDWTQCNWTMNSTKVLKIIGATLREVLERHTLPPNVSGHSDYANRAIEEAVVLYAFRMGTTRDPLRHPSHPTLLAERSGSATYQQYNPPIRLPESQQLGQDVAHGQQTEPYPNAQSFLPTYNVDTTYVQLDAESFQVGSRDAQLQEHFIVGDQHVMNPPTRFDDMDVVRQDNPAEFSHQQASLQMPVDPNRFPVKQRQLSQSSIYLDQKRMKTKKSFTNFFRRPGSTKSSGTVPGEVPPIPSRDPQDRPKTPTSTRVEADSNFITCMTPSPQQLPVRSHRPTSSIYSLNSESKDGDGDYRMHESLLEYLQQGKVFPQAIQPSLDDYS